MDLYYRHSGKFSPLGAALTLALGSAAGAALGYAYAYAILYIPVAGWITFLITAAFGVGVGYSTGRMLVWQKTRNLLVARGVTLAVTAAAFYVSWAAWVMAFLRRGGENVALTTALTRPAALWATIVAINHQGAWSLSGSAPTGTLLWVLWGLEAVAIFGLALLVGEAQYDATAFCESCDRWCRIEKNIAAVAPAPAADLKGRLEGHDFNYLRGLGPVRGAAWTQLDLHTCPGCAQLNAVDALQVTRTIKKGRAQDQKKKVVSRLLVSPAEVEQLRALKNLAAASASAS